MIAEVGVARTTHRAVAQRAGVPLGATTYYFPTLADMVAEALAEAARAYDAELERRAERLGDGDDLPARLTDLLAELLDDRRTAVTEYELYLAAARTPELRPLAVQWLDGLRRLLTPLVGAQAAWGAAALVDGVLVGALATGTPLDRAATAASIGALLAGDRPSSGR